MQTVLLSLSMLLGLFCAGCAHGQDAAHIPGSDDIAAMVFVGEDAQMPTTGRFLFAVDPPRGADGVIPPRDLAQFLTLSNEALPHWFIVGLNATVGDSECSLTVGGGADYVTAYIDWAWVNWGFRVRDSGVRRGLSSMKIEDEDSAKMALRMGLCSYLKDHDSKVALTIMSKYGGD